ncbi:MAG TPA: hypothetical protein VHQ43_04490 [Solirubrobacterales bacterium]|jgi:hypothetical protein|nr:hypothetical protein [Solirubrobacterales bacterium]
MSLDGLRAWIGEVERKLGMRTRVFLVLAVIAIGGAGAAIYLAIEAQNDSVSESDAQALQRELEERFAGGVAGGSATALEAEIDSLKAEVEALKGAGGTGQSGGTGSGSDGQGSKDSGAGAGTESDGAAGGASTDRVPIPPSASGGKDAARLQELVEQTREKSAQIEKEERAGR